MSAPAAQRNVPLKDIYSDPLDRFWHLYLLDAEKQDAKLTERWKGDADGILIFVCARFPTFERALMSQRRPACLLLRSDRSSSPSFQTYNPLPPTKAPQRSCSLRSSSVRFLNSSRLLAQLPPSSTSHHRKPSPSRLTPSKSIFSGS
jgi:hypothetical protein